MSAATAAARRPAAVAGRPGRAGRGPEPLAAASIIAAINTRLCRRCRAPGRGPQVSLQARAARYISGAADLAANGGKLPAGGPETARSQLAATPRPDADGLNAITATDW